MLIGVGGYLTAGKDVLADHLAAEHGFTKIGMSDPLNKALYTLNPIIQVRKFYFERYQVIHDKLGYTEAKTIPEVRRLLQALGTDVGRKQLNDDLWKNVAEKNIHELMAQGKSVVITGMRYRNELTMIRENGGTLVWVDRPGVEAPENAHDSERGLAPKDFEEILHNGGTIADFHAVIDDWLSIRDSRMDYEQARADYHWPIYDH